MFALSVFHVLEKLNIPLMRLQMLLQSGFLKKMICLGWEHISALSASSII
jgi:hypothetical protein